MKNILIQLTIFLSISSFAQYNNSFGGGNGPYKEMRDVLIRQTEEHKEEIKERAKLLAERMGYDYDSLEVAIAVPIEKEANPFFITHTYAEYWDKAALTKKEIELLEKTGGDTFSGMKLFYNETDARFLDGEFYVIRPIGGNEIFQIAEEQIATAEEHGIVSAFSADHDWNYEEEEIDAVQFVIQVSPNISASRSSLSTGHIDFGFSHYMIDPSSEKGIYAAEPIGGGGGLGGSGSLGGGGGLGGGRLHIIQ